MESLENARLLVPRYADAVVDDVDERLLVPGADADIDASRFARVFHGVSKQIEYRLGQRLRVRPQRRLGAVTRDVEREAELQERMLHRPDSGLHDVLESRVLQVIRPAPPFDAREIEHAV